MHIMCISTGSILFYRYVFSAIRDQNVCPFSNYDNWKISSDLFEIRIEDLGYLADPDVQCRTSSWNIWNAWMSNFSTFWAILEGAEDYKVLFL